jgi:hypothetical protein
MCASMKYQMLSQIFRDTKGCGITWAKMLNVSIAVAYPELRLLDSQCDVGIGALAPLQCCWECAKCIRPLADVRSITQTPAQTRAPTQDAVHVACPRWCAAACSICRPNSDDESSTVRGYPSPPWVENLHSDGSACGEHLGVIRAGNRFALCADPLPMMRRPANPAWHVSQRKRARVCNLPLPSQSSSAARANVQGVCADCLNGDPPRTVSQSMTDYYVISLHQTECVPLMAAQEVLAFAPGASSMMVQDPHHIADAPQPESTESLPRTLRAPSDANTESSWSSSVETPSTHQ